MTQNVIYCLSCSKCKVQYVGETKRATMIRLKEHLADITNKRNKPVSNHFLKPNHDPSHLVPTILETVSGDPTLATTTSFRRERERIWIYRLRSPTPLGLNVMV